MNIVVLCAGSSTEREVSIVSGTQVCKALRENGHNARLLDLYFGEETVLADQFFDGDYELQSHVAEIKKNSALLNEARKVRKGCLGPNVLSICENCDVVFLALHGSNGEDGRLQATFDLLDIRYTGTGYLGSALAMDKGMTKHLLVANNLPTPKGYILHKKDENAYALEKLSENGINYPCVVKPCCGGSSIGVSIAKNDEAYIKALDDAFALENEIVVEEYINGREFSVGVVNHSAYPVVEIIVEDGFYDYENKYNGKPREVCPAALTEEQAAKMQECAVKVSEVLRLGKYSRIDFLMDTNDDIYCLEANTLPGMTPTSLLPQEAAALGMSFGQLCELLIEE